MRERIEGGLDPRERERRKRAAAPPDPEFVLMEVRDFVELAGSGAYIAGDRRMSRTERTKWRVTFRLLATEAQSALHATDSGPAEEAMELMIDLACHADGCFRWDDPLEAAKFVLSRAVSALWDTVLDVRGAAEFTARAVPQLMRWNGSTTEHTAWAPPRCTRRSGRWLRCSRQCSPRRRCGTPLRTPTSPNWTGSQPRMRRRR